MKKVLWGPERKRDAALFAARRYARFERMEPVQKWEIVEIWLRRAVKHATPTDLQIRHLIELGAGRLVAKLKLAGGREL